jgi:serine/threonine protein kinase
MGLANGVTIQGMRGTYTIESLIDIGGLGRVWKARSNTGAIVAVKEPLTDGSPDQVRVNFEKLRIEAIVLEKLTGPRPLLLSDSSHAYTIDPGIRLHIVRFIDVDKDAVRPNRQVYPTLLVMDYINGTSMDNFRSSKTLSASEVDRYWIMALRILKSLHENNILHRDISPHNLMSTRDHETDPVLIDFGTAKEGYNQLSVDSSEWSRILKVGFSAPELSTGRPPPSPSSDLYSVAATALFLYTGRMPNILQTDTGEFDIARRSELRRIPDGRLEIIKKSMNLDPHYRYQTAEEVLDVLGGKIIPIVAGPYIIASGRKFQIQRNMIIGRSHRQCAVECRRKGFSNLPDIALNDPQSFVGRHHARIRLASNGECFIEDLHAVSGTALKHHASQAFERIQPGREYLLRDGDLIALAYSPLKGPYITISYREK